MFPDGVAALQKKVGLPFVMHNRWYTPHESWYQRNGIGGSEWTGEGKAAIALDQDAFWSFFFTQQEGYGLATYEQDFMFTQYDAIPAMQENATLADDWLRFMAHHAAKANFTMQYSMPYARDFLASTQFENVVTIRASDDYHAGKDNWKISRSSLLSHAVGVLPSKDTFLSNDGKEEGGARWALGPEPTPYLQLLVAVLSASIVGPGDGIGYLNKTRLMASCRADGLLLKADRPAVPLDAHWTKRDPGGETFWSPSSSGGVVTRYLLAASLSRDYTMALTEVGISPEEVVLGYNWFTQELRHLDSATPLELKAESTQGGSRAVPFEYWVLAPKVGSWFLLGDTSKFVTNSVKRIASVSVSGNNLQVSVVGAPREQIRLCAVEDGQHAKVICQERKLSLAGRTIITFSSVSNGIVVI